MNRHLKCTPRPSMKTPTYIRCSFCKRPLRDPVSKRLGLGPECGGEVWEKMEEKLKGEIRLDQERRRLNSIDQLDLFAPIQCKTGSR